MSRIGKAPISIPSGVTVEVKENVVTVKGAKGELTQDLPPAVTVDVSDNTVTVKPTSDHPKARGFWGLTRTLIANMIKGVSEGFEKQLVIKGVGYKVAEKGKDLELALGFSHPVSVKAPEGISFVVDQKKLTITVQGIHKQRVGETAAKIRAHRPPEPYKGKGIAYVGEYIRRKAGKAASK